MNILHFKPSESKNAAYNYPYLLKQTNHKDEENPYSTILPLANEYEKFVYSLRQQDFQQSILSVKYFLTFMFFYC